VRTAAAASSALLFLCAGKAPLHGLRRKVVQCRRKINKCFLLLWAKRQLGRKRSWPVGEIGRVPTISNTLRPIQSGRHFPDIFKCIFLNKNLYILIKIYRWNMFTRVQFTIIQHWFRWWLGADQMTSHYLNQWWLFYWRIYASLGLNELISTTCGNGRHFLGNFHWEPSVWCQIWPQKLASWQLSIFSVRN